MSDQLPEDRANWRTPSNASIRFRPVDVCSQLYGNPDETLTEESFRRAPDKDVVASNGDLTRSCHDSNLGLG